MKSYVLLTSALNEERFLEDTIRSIRAQSRLPGAWVLVDDGSTDGTADVVKRHLGTCPFLHLHQRPVREARAFSSKAVAVNEAFALADRASPGADYVAVLDADMTLDPDYYQRIIERFEQDPRLGVAGGMVLEQVGDRFVSSTNDPQWSVRGAVQVFRRACFEQVGGYFPSRVGGVDAIAEVMARMRGYTVRTFPETRAYHRRRTGTAGQSLTRSVFRRGIQNYVLGYHPLFMLARCLSRAGEKPYVLRGLTLASGYVWAALRREPRELPREFVRYLRREQLRRLFGRQN
jgi:glycosyltransferase involved in cell wall biosynthesis